jgi:hypothetical protein
MFTVDMKVYTNVPPPPQKRALSKLAINYNYFVQISSA